MKRLQNVHFYQVMGDFYHVMWVEKGCFGHFLSGVCVEKASISLFSSGLVLRYFHHKMCTFIAHWGVLCIFYCVLGCSYHIVCIFIMKCPFFTMKRGVRGSFSIARREFLYRVMGCFHHEM